MGLFDNLYGSGQQYGNLVDDPARQEAKRRALLAISTQLMQAGGPSRLPVSTGQAIGSALQAGQGASDEAYKSAVEAAMLRKRMEPQPKDRGRLVMVAGPDGKPVYQYEDQAAGKMPYMEPQGAASNSTPKQEYELAKSTGFTGSYEQWLKRKKELESGPYQPNMRLVDQQMPDGSVQKVWIDEKQGPGGPTTPFGAPKAAANEATEGERTSGNYLGRMQAAEGLLGNYQPNTKDFIAAQRVMSGGPVSSVLFNSALSPEGQKYYQAAGDWVRAKLRKESGAVISPEEMAQEIKTYFPLPNDDPGTVAQKAQARQQAQQGMRDMAGRSAPAASGAPKVGEVRRGYKFLGGDPSKPSSWEKQ